MIRHLLFDMGGVIFTQNTQEAFRRFKAIGLDPDYYMGEYGQKDFFLDVETGKISTDDFFKKVAEVTGDNSLGRDDLLQCWLGFFDGVRWWKIWTDCTGIIIYVCSATPILSSCHTPRAMLSQRKEGRSPTFLTRYSSVMRWESASRTLAFSSKHCRWNR